MPTRPAPTASEKTLALLQPTVEALVQSLGTFASSPAWHRLQRSLEALSAAFAGQPAPGPVAAVPEPLDVQAISDFLGGWAATLFGPSFLQQSSAQKDTYHAVLPPEAEADGLGELASF